RARLPARDVRAGAVPGDRGRRRPAERAPEDLSAARASGVEPAQDEARAGHRVDGRTHQHARRHRHPPHLHSVRAAPVDLTERLLTPTDRSVYTYRSDGP